VSLAIAYVMAVLYVALGMIVVGCAAFIVVVFISSLIELAAVALGDD
jgi:hypothetical protein